MASLSVFPPSNFYIFIVLVVSSMMDWFIDFSFHLCVISVERKERNKQRKIGIAHFVFDLTSAEIEVEYWINCSI